VHEVAWKGQLFEGGWRRRVNAGGCRNYPATFWTNPQYNVTVVDPDSDDDDGTGTILIGLMQKERRKLKKLGHDNLTIGYAVYKSPYKVGATPLDKRFFSTNTSSAKSTAFINLREVSDHHKLPPGDYVVVPSTFEPNEEADFVLRVYTETKKNRTKELDDVTGVTDIKPKPPVASEEEGVNAGYKAFVSLAGTDGEVDAFELQNILNTVFTRDFQFDGFSTDMTRSMVAMKDTDFSGKLGYEDFKSLWSDLLLCKQVFKDMDTDKSGHFNSYELREALGSMGYHVSNATFNAIVVRYSDKDGHIRFDDFVQCYIKLKSLFAGFRNKDQAGYGRARFSFDEFTMFTMYS
jgi:calpain